ncbi:MAG: DUF2700 domain-containing protein [Fenollaria timonensis]
MEILRIILPLLMVCAIVIYTLYAAKKMQNDDKGEKTEENYMSEGMSIGMCLGFAISTALRGDTAIGLSVGMMLGMAIGMSIKKK